MDWRVGDAGGVAFGQCSRPVPALTCVAGHRWVRSSGKKPKRVLFHPGDAGEGKTGRANVSEPPLMTRYPELREMGWRRGAGPGRGGTANGGRTVFVGRVSTAGLGSRGRPPRSKHNPPGPRLLPSRAPSPPARKPSTTDLHALAAERKITSRLGIRQRLVERQLYQVVEMVLRAVAADTPGAEAIKVVARAHQTLIWKRTRHTLRLRSALREFFPAAQVAYAGLGLTGSDTLELLVKSPDPASAAKLSLTPISAALSGPAAMTRRGDQRRPEHPAADPACRYHRGVCRYRARWASNVMHLAGDPRTLKHPRLRSDGAEGARMKRLTVFDITV
jgi:hypothetical protein